MMCLKNIEKYLKSWLKMVISSVSIQILIATALWCGQPISNNGYMKLRSKDQVNKCRQDISECMAKSKNGQDLLVCIEKEQLK